jgi:hypothetical protein
LAYGDPAYYLLNWIIANLGGGIYLVNFVCACILMTGVASFALKQPAPWIALLVAVPYLLIVVGMGYSRQSAAIGLAMLGYVALGEAKLRKFVCFTLLAALFHKSAALLIPIAALTATKNKAWTIFWICAAVVLMYFAVLNGAGADLWEHYVEEDMESQGALIRVMMNGVPAILFVIFGKRLTHLEAERKFWMWMAMLSLGCLLVVKQAPAAVDRMALYFIPIQLYVFARLHRASENIGFRAWIILGTAFYYGFTLWAWLNFASHVEYWLPYQFTSIEFI